MAPKKKQEKMNLGEFLTNQSLGSWADEMDAQPIMPAVPASSGYGRDRDGGERRAFTQPAWETARTGSGVGGGMGGRGASYDRPRFDREQLPLPTKPPYTAHLGNLTYDVSQADIENFFKDCQVTNVRLVEDKLDHKPKGFGYVEFATLEGLKLALTYTETNLVGRNVKISVAEPPKDRPEPTRDFSDWSRKGPLPELPQNTRQPSRGFSRNFNDNMSDAGSERGGGGGGARRPAFFEGDGKVRDFSNWERKGPLSPVPNTGPPMRDGGRVREGGGPPRERRPSPAWGEGRSDAGSRPPRREFEPRPPVERVPTAAEQDNQWRTGMRPDPSPAPTPDVSTPSSPQQQAPQAPKERPKLNLQKRTVSTAVEGEASTSASADSKASPFGAARPVDTATKEREVEEKRQLAIRQKREADEKAKDDKAKQEAAARAARAERADRGQAQEDVVTSPISETGKGRRASRQQNGTKQTPPKENGETPTSTAKPNFTVLRRDAEGDPDSEGPAPGEEETGEDEINGSAAAAQLPDAGATDPAQTVIEGAVPDQELSAKEVADGWETVQSGKKNNRRGGQSRQMTS